MLISTINNIAHLCVLSSAEPSARSISAGYLKICLQLLFLVAASSECSHAQIVYSQTFSSTLAASAWTNTNLTTPWSSGTYLGLFSNNWYLDDAETGMPANTCGVGFGGNQSLYMGAVGLGALGAAYVANARTNRRISSPNINTIGYAGMTLSFNFIANGVSTIDKAYFQYSIDGGATWILPPGGPTSTTPALPAGSDWSNLKSQVCAGGQGRWTNVIWAMPAACEGISNLRIGFVWQNNNSTPGATDPCLAVDDIVISVIITPVTLSSFDIRCNNSKVIVAWTTQSEVNNDYFILESCADMIHWRQVGVVPGSGNSISSHHYVFEHAWKKSDVYYRLSQVDYDGRTTHLYSSTKGECDATNGNLAVYPNPTQGLFYISGERTTDISCIELLDLQGRIVFSQRLNASPASQVEVALTQLFTAGMYVLMIRSKDGDVEEFKLMVE